MAGMLGLVMGQLGYWLPTLLLITFITLLLCGKFGGRPKNFPPGPVILPFLGSILSMPFGPTTEIIRGLKKKYGDMASFGIFGNRIVVVSGVSLMKEVFNLKGTANRPEAMYSTSMSIMITDGRSSYTGLLGTGGQVWLENRRFMLHRLRDLGFGKTSSEAIMIEEVAKLMDHLAEEEGKSLEMERVFYRSVLNILWGMVMGKRYSYSDPRMTKLLNAFFHSGDFNFLDPLQHIPYILHVMPYLPIEKEVMKSLRRVTDFLKTEINGFLKNEELKNGDNLMANYLREIEKKENPNFNMEQLAGLVFDLFAAGMETTSSTLSTGVYLVAKHPHVQHHLQEELDKIVGKDRVPSLADMERLPYVQATVCEVQRVFNLAKVALPHMCSEDCKLGGYDIPQGTWLLPNLEDALTSPEYWKNPREFDPQNFFDENGKFKKNEAFLPFGIGKRRCVGEPLAKLEVFLFFSHVFHRFTVTLLEEKRPISEACPSFNLPPNYTASVKCRSSK